MAGLFVLNASATQGGGIPPAFHIERSDADELIVDVLPKTYREQTILVDGEPYIIFEARLSGSTADSGKPQLPAEGFSFAIPPGKKPVLDIIESKFEFVQHKNIAPAPSYSFTEEGEAAPHYRVDREFYVSHNQLYPPALVEFGEVRLLRNLRVGNVLLHPLQYNPSTAEVRKITHLKLRIRFVQQLRKSDAIWQATARSDPHFDSFFKDLLVNYDQASAWRGREVNESTIQAADSSGNWFVPGRSYFSVPIIADGVYQLTYSDLLGYGIDLTLMNNSTLALYYKGQSQPLLVQTADTLPQNWFLEFYAHRNLGVNSYFNRYDDTSSYWLTWNDATPKRFAPSSVTSVPLDTVRWSMATSRQEEDKNYFFGVTQDEIQTTDDVPGEGWYWMDFVSGTSRSFPFTIDTVQRQTGNPVQMRARLHGMTICTGGACRAPSRHSAQFKLNGSLIGSIDWTDNTEAIFMTTFSDSLLLVGSNTLQVISKTWTAADSNISKFYLDWFDVSHPRPLSSTNGSLQFTSASPVLPDTTMFIVNGISSDSATVLNLTDGRLMTSLSPITAQSFSFTDTLSRAKEYYVVQASGMLKPARLEQKVFKNLRSNATGADYIVITHSLFQSEADRLAQHRAATNGLRTAVVDVQDIYDEFNYGHLDPEAIRVFLKHTFNFWQSPAPSYAVIFGDASWDFKKNLATSVKQNFVPSYGNPPSDNALVSFDSVQNYLPNMFIGRIPAENLTEANQVVTKIIGYDTPPLSRWNKSFLFITGGDTPSEKATFNFWSDDLINRYVTPAPVGGVAYKVYKSTDAIIDGDSKPYMQNLIRDGISFVNFIGHSGGRIWSVDIGDPNQLQNINGELPFISSVSCNVGFFSDPRANVLAEDFLMADNRGGIAAWAGSSIGYGSVGRALVDKLLSSAAHDSNRSLGMLTTIARLYYYQINTPTTPLVIQTLQLHPLLGDPYTQLAMPLKPDFDVSSNNIVLKDDPPTSDSVVTLDVSVDNFGLMAGKQVMVSITDNYITELGQAKRVSDIVPPFYIPDFGMRDNFFVRWNVKGLAGSHTVTVKIDPLDSIAEIRKNNNTAQQTFYIYRNTIAVVKPSNFDVITSTAPTFVVTVPSGRDTTPLSYVFEIDTASSFSSASKIVSPNVAPGSVATTWQSPMLNTSQTYYWRSRSTDGSKVGAWRTSSFYLSPDGQSPDTLHWRQSTPAQFASGSLQTLSVIDSGVQLVLHDSTKLYARSVGSRYNQTAEFYSTLKINDVTAVGYWWQNAYSFLSARYNPTNGSYIMKGFDLLKAGYVDSLFDFLNQTPVGSYVMLAAVLNAKQNVTEPIYQQIEALGSTSIRTVTSGQSWLLICRKGDGVAIVEDYQPTGIAEQLFTVGNVYSNGLGTIASPPIGPASKWISASWNVVLPNGNTFSTMRILGVKANGAIDTLMTQSGGSSAVDLTSVNPIVYPRIKLAASLFNNDGASTPTLKEWDVRNLPPPDLAISAWTFHADQETVRTDSSLRLMLDVYNIGYLRSDSARLSFYAMEDSVHRVDIMIDSLGVNQQRHVEAQLRMGGAKGPRTIVAHVGPNALSNDLIEENNTTIISVTAIEPPVSVGELHILFDGKEIEDGDFVSASPTITIELPQNQIIQGVNLLSLPVRIDGKPAIPSSTESNTDRRIAIHESFVDGDHQLEIYSSPQALPQQLMERTIFRVLKAPQILQVFNYPNPFSSQTVFTFLLTGTTLSEDVHIKVFTVAGRMVRDLVISQHQLQFGFNRAYWDGRDEEGDELANGNYLYRISMKSEGVSASAIQRLTIVR